MMPDVQIRSTWQIISSRQRTFLWIWSIGLILVLFAIGWIKASPLRQYKQESAERHRARMSRNEEEFGTTAPDSSLPENAQPVYVTVGFYVDRISNLSVRDLSWTVDFYVWFRWKGNSVEPGSDFHVVDGWMESKVKETEELIGDEHYERYRVIATITEPFNVSRFPLDEHLLTIKIENPLYQRHQMVFVPDLENTSASSRLKVPAYEVQRAELIEKPHSYKTTRGDPRLPPGVKSNYSQARLGIGLHRVGWGYFFKMFQSLYVALMIAMLAMFIKPTNVDPRFGLGIGGLFAAVANSYATSSLIPDTGIMTLADMVNGVGVWMILLTVIQSIVSLHISERLGAEELSRRFDRISFVILAAGCVGINLAMPLAAYS
jgi:hypothetical protein